MDRLGNLGLLLIGVGLCIWGFNAKEKPQKIEVPKPDYQIIQLGDMARNQFLIDKVNGRIWERICYGKSTGADCDGEIMWEEMFIENLSPPGSPPALVHSYVKQFQADKAASEHK